MPSSMFPKLQVSRVSCIVNQQNKSLLSDQLGKITGHTGEKQGFLYFLNQCDFSGWLKEPCLEKHHGAKQDTGSIFRMLLDNTC
jgi:hypothetical protein